MCDYFCNFIRNGDPNGKDLNGEELPAWETWSEENPAAMRFTGSGPVQEKKNLPPLQEFLKDRILERMQGNR